MLSTGSNPAAKIVGAVPKRMPTDQDTTIATTTESAETGMWYSVKKRTDSFGGRLSSALILRAMLGAEPRPTPTSNNQRKRAGYEGLPKKATDSDSSFQLPELEVPRLPFGVQVWFLHFKRFRSSPPSRRNKWTHVGLADKGRLYGWNQVGFHVGLENISQRTFCQARLHELFFRMNRQEHYFG